MTIIQINTIVNSGSTGRIPEDIGTELLANGHTSVIAFGRGNRPSKSQLLRIGNKQDFYWHVFQTMAFDRHGFASVTATKKLISQIDTLKPDAVGLHNLHGYYLNVELLFEYLAAKKLPVVWTLHDCWAFTGHCTYFDSVGCEKWKTQCQTCPKTRFYPASYGLDNSVANYKDKKKLFNLPSNVHLVTPSVWLKKLVGQSFLQHPVQTIHNGVDLTVFKPSQNDFDIKGRYQTGGKKIILGVASTWDKRKGLDDFLQLNNNLSTDEVIVLVGLSRQQMKLLPGNIIGIERTENVDELAALYAAACVFVNPTWQDNFPTTNIEALACGTPVITYDTGGSPEAIDAATGCIVEKGNIKMLYEKIQLVLTKGKAHFTPLCRDRAVKFFNKDDRYRDYLNLYQSILHTANA